MIGIVDYGMGNIKAFSNIYKQLDIPHKIIKSREHFKDVEKIILPGVGAFDHAMMCLEKSGLLETLNDLVLNKKKPILGVCVGMQMMAQGSDEGHLKGLGWIDASVRHFSELTNEKIDLPHMGWNDVQVYKEHPLFKNLEKDAIFYFLHSYYFQEGSDSQIMSRTDYGEVFTSSIFKGNIFGVQFHPEKSHHWGVQLLKNFSELPC